MLKKHHIKYDPQLFYVGPHAYIPNIFKQLIVWIDSDNSHSRTTVFIFYVTYQKTSCSYHTLQHLWCTNIKFKFTDYKKISLDICQLDYCFSISYLEKYSTRCHPATRGRIYAVANLSGAVVTTYSLFYQ